MNENFGYEGCTLTVETSDIDNKVTFAPLAKGEKQIDMQVQDVVPDSGLVYALAVAAAGRHHVLVYGQPSNGRDYTTSQITQFMPNLLADEQTSVNRIFSIAGLTKPNQKIIERPFRAPHTTASIEGMCGGGPNCMPGEVSFAHNGVLFLKDAAEFKTSVLQMLRVPLENKNITLSRGGRSTTYPANLQLVMTVNPCPCGNLGSESRICLCSAQAIRQYWAKFSAPLLDCMSIRYNTNAKVPHMFVGYSELRKRVKSAVEKQLRRQGKFNQELSDDEVTKHCKLTYNAQNALDLAVARYNISPRAKANIIRLARTVLDLKDGEWDEIGQPSMEQAIALYGKLPEQVY
jgi:magnesium chelatase family protein